MKLYLIIGVLGLVMACEGEPRPQVLPNSPTNNTNTPNPNNNTNSSAQIAKLNKQIEELSKLVGQNLKPKIESPPGKNPTAPEKLQALSGDDAKAFVRSWCGDAVDNVRTENFDSYVGSKDVPQWVADFMGKDSKKTLAELRASIKKAAVPSGKVVLADFDGGPECREYVLVVDALAAAYLKKLKDAKSDNALTCGKKQEADNEHSLNIATPAIYGDEDDEYDSDFQAPCAIQDVHKKAIVLVGNSDGTLASLDIDEYTGENRTADRQGELTFQSIILEEDGSLALFRESDSALKLAAADFGLYEFDADDKEQWKKLLDAVATQPAAQKIENNAARSFISDVEEWCGDTTLKNLQVFDVDNYLDSKDISTWLIPWAKARIRYDEVNDSFVEDGDSIINSTRTSLLNPLVPNGNAVLAEFDGGKSCRRHLVVIDTQGMTNLKKIKADHSTNALTCSKKKVKGSEYRFHISVPAANKIYGELQEESTCTGYAKQDLMVIVSGHKDGTVSVARLRGGYLSDKNENATHTRLSAFIYYVLEDDGSIAFAKGDGALKFLSTTMSDAIGGEQRSFKSSPSSGSGSMGKGSPAE